MQGFRADAMVGDTVFEVLVEPRDVRRLRASLMELARLAASAGVRRSLLILEEPQITENRLHEEWEGALAVMRPDIATRVGLIVRRYGHWTGIPEMPFDIDIPVLEQILQHELSRQSKRPGRGSDALNEILRILIHHWMLGKGPISVNGLMDASGKSYPTVAKSLERLDHCLTRHSDRSVELRFFPKDDWAKLLAVADDLRGTVRFADRSGQPRPQESMLRRIQMLGRKDIAVGGVAGAKHYLPSLDLVGSPRIDLSIHAQGKDTDLSFVERIDPGLQRNTRRDEAASLVVHLVRRANPFFEEQDGDGIPWADPVECLLDLHEARLEPQAKEFVSSFAAKKKGRVL